MKGFTFPTNNHNQNQSSSYFKDNYIHPSQKNTNKKRNRINKSQFYDINNHPYHKDIIYAYNPKQTNLKNEKKIIISQYYHIKLMITYNT